MSSSSIVGSAPTSGQGAPGARRPRSEWRSITPALVSGAVVGLLVIISVLGLPPSHTTSQSGGAPPFDFEMSIASNYSGGAASFYNLTTNWVSNESLTLSWVQFYISTGNSSQVVNFTVVAMSKSSVQVGLFNSTLSLWRGAASASTELLDQFGGWSSGGSVPFEQSYLFQLKVPRPPAIAELYVGMSLSTAPYEKAIESLLL